MSSMYITVVSSVTSVSCPTCRLGQLNRALALCPADAALVRGDSPSNLRRDYFQDCVKTLFMGEEGG